MWDSAVRFVRRLFKPLVPRALLEGRRRRLREAHQRAMEALAQRTGALTTVHTEPLAGLEFECSSEVRAALAAIGRTEDVQFSPSGGRLALAGFLTNRILVLTVRVIPAGASHRVVIDGHVMLASAALARPHGFAFVDEDTLIVANREGSVSLLRIPADDREEIEVTPLRKLRGGRLQMRFVPGSVSVYPVNGTTFRALVCDNASNAVLGYSLTLGDPLRARFRGVVVGRGLTIPDGIGVSADRRWVAVSNHGEGAVRVYENGPGLDRHSDASAVLRGIAFPHGVRFTADGRHLVVADAGGPWVHVFASPSGEWTGDRQADFSVKVIDDEAFGRGNVSPGEGGTKGVDLDPAMRVMVTTCEEQVLAFFDLQQLLAGTHPSA